MDGLEATRQLTGLCPHAHILALTVHEDKQYFFEMLAAGATGYMTKQAAADELVAAIHAVAQGYVYLQPTLARWLVDDYRRLAELSHVADADQVGGVPTGEEKVLSKRERQVLELVADGKTTPQISEQLGISPKTVARHRERIMNKLNLHSAAELVKFAIRQRDHRIISGRIQRFLVHIDECADGSEVEQPLGVFGTQVDAAIAHGVAEVVVPVGAV
jgi:two-component system, NarL family, response regulator NreC